MSDELGREILREVMALHSRLSAIERTLKIHTTALAILINLENTEMSNTNTMQSILAAALALAASSQSGLINEQHLLDGATQHVADLEQKLADAQANQADQATLDQISAAVATAQKVADAMNQAGQTPTPAPVTPPADTPAAATDTDNSGGAASGTDQPNA